MYFHQAALAPALWFFVLAPLALGQHIGIDPNLRWYWSYQGQPVLLLGGSDEDNLFNHPALMTRNLAALTAVEGNYLRCTLSWRDGGNVPPFAKTNGRYDLTRWNPEFWDRLKRFLDETRRRDIIVQIEIWATFDYYRDNWRRNPFNPANNVNYTAAETKLETEWEHHPAREPQPFFSSPPALNDDQVLLRYQQAFARQALQTALPYPNVLFCLDNETRAPLEWALYWGRFLREEAARQGHPIELTEMWDPWDLGDPRHAGTYDYPSLFSFTDVSQNNWNRGEQHYRRLVEFRSRLLAAGGPRPMNNVKIYGAVRPRQPAVPELNIDRFWKGIFGGCASVRFHRPPTGIGLSEDAQRTLRAARRFTSEFPIFSTEPLSNRLTEREEDEAYCLGAAGQVYAVYLPRGGDVTLETGPLSRSWRVRWFDPRRAAFQPPTTQEGPAIRLVSPSGDQAWLALVDAGEHPRF